MDPKFSRDEIDFGFFTLTLEIRTIFRNLTKNCSTIAVATQQETSRFRRESFDLLFPKLNIEYVEHSPSNL